MSETTQSDKVADDADVAFAPADLTDGREQYDWTTKYADSRARRPIMMEALYLALLIVLSVGGFIVLELKAASAAGASVSVYFYSISGGLLGGATFAAKWLYHSVAKGIWHIDRMLWRLFAPAASAGQALAVVILIHSTSERFVENGILSGASSWSIAFVLGYFGDNVLGRLIQRTIRDTSS